MREIIFKMVEKGEAEDYFSKLYDWFITMVAFISLIPLMFRGEHPFLDILDIATVYILFMDYIFRWITYDIKSKSKNDKKAFVKYPFTILAIIDLLSILPSLGLLNSSFQILRTLRIFKVMHYSKNFVYISNVFKKERKTLTSVLVIALTYIYVSALAMFSYEPDTFDNFFEALYWATTALTTVGYGDIFPVTQVGKFISMVSSLFGIAVIALPAGIVTGGFIEQIQKDQKGKTEETEEILEEHTFHFSGLHIGPLNKNQKRYLGIMLIGVLMNQLLFMMVCQLNLPIWLDVSGTVLVAFMLEPTAGLIVGLINNFYLSIFVYGSNSLLYYAISAAAALLFGILLRDKKGNLTKKNIPKAAMYLFLISTILATLLTMWRSGGIPTGNWETMFYEKALEWQFPKVFACLFGTAVVKFLDTIAVVLVVPIFCFLLPKQWKEQYNYKDRL